MCFLLFAPFQFHASGNPQRVAVSFVVHSTFVQSWSVVAIQVRICLCQLPRCLEPLHVLLVFSHWAASQSTMHWSRIQNLLKAAWIIWNHLRILVPIMSQLDFTSASSFPCWSLSRLTRARQGLSHVHVYFLFSFLMRWRNQTSWISALVRCVLVESLKWSCEFLVTALT